MAELKSRETSAHADFSSNDNPFAIYADWAKEAAALEPNDPNAMAVATVDADGLPNLRMVLCKDADERGFVFYTNFESAKGLEIAATGKAAALFHWKSLRRQVRLRGPVEVVSEADADAYYLSRARGSRIGAWASRQSSPLESRAALVEAVAAFEVRYPDAVPRPPHWSGFRLVPTQIEFWRDGEHRLHDRFLFARSSAAAPWVVTRLNP